MKIQNDLFIFEMANNHQGDVEHGIKIIKAMSQIAKKFNLTAAVKLQYRQLDSFIHPDKKKDTKAKHIGRFLSTRLANEQFLTLVNTIKEEGMLSLVTPFDEASVDVIEEHNVDMIKIASCSADDWPLIARIAKSDKPVIASTAGLELWQIDNLVSYLSNRVNDLSVLHCVGIYPTPNEKLHLNFLNTMIKRYPKIKIGYSGHEAPENTDVIKVAASKGARVFERHVGLPTETIKLNGYSMNPKQTEKWVQSYFDVKSIMGNDIKEISEDEIQSLLSLKRGVFLNKDLKKGSFISEKDVFYAMPCQDGQVTSGEFGRVRARYMATKNYKTNEALFESWTEDTYHKVRRIVHQGKAMLVEANIVLSDNYEVELSHHYGIEKFESFGCLIVNLVNREYCKKIIVVYPGQHHPEQKHLKKEETFHVLSGNITIILNGISRELKKGDIVTIERGVTHAFYSENGGIIEEVSTTHLRNDSFYTDPLIAEQDPMQRKTVLSKL